MFEKVNIHATSEFLIYDCASVVIYITLTLEHTNVK